MGCRVVEWKFERNGAYGIEQEERTGARIGTDLMALFR